MHGDVHLQKSQGERKDADKKHDACEFNLKESTRVIVKGSERGSSRQKASAIARANYLEAICPSLRYLEH
jgi:hypothetical protein